MEEIDILDENGNKLNDMRTIEEIHKLGLWHRAVVVLIINSKGKILVQQRAGTKVFFPNAWEMCLTGHVDAGELSIETAIREIGEEVGLIISKKDLSYIYSFRREYFAEGSIERLFFDVFCAKTNFDENDVKIQEEEVQAFKLINLNELKEMIDNGLVHTDNETNILIDLMEKGVLC